MVGTNKYNNRFYIIITYCNDFVLVYEIRSRIVSEVISGTFIVADTPVFRYDSLPSRLTSFTKTRDLSLLKQDEEKNRQKNQERGPVSQPSRSCVPHPLSLSLFTSPLPLFPPLPNAPSTSKILQHTPRRVGRWRRERGRLKWDGVRRVNSLCVVYCGCKKMLKFWRFCLVSLIVFSESTSVRVVDVLIHYHVDSILYFHATRSCSLFPIYLFTLTVTPCPLPIHSLTRHHHHQ